ncbi:MAG: calcium/proton exchanger [Chloroflexota bacterium]
MMSVVIRRVQQHPLDLLLFFFPLAILGKVIAYNPIWIFALSAIGVIPLAGYIGEATEALVTHTSPRLGGLLNATLGNAAELIITIVAIREGLLELVKASITGSILGNLLLVMGTSFLLGGLKNGLQSFHKKQATRNAILLILAVLALLIPSVLSHYIGQDNDPRVESLSIGVAGIMIILYILSLIYSFKPDNSPLLPDKNPKSIEKTSWSLYKSITVLAGATIGVVILSELLVSTVEPVVTKLGISEFFLGIILIPIIGNVAEHSIAVSSAIRDKMELSVEISISSSLQIALFVAPVLVFLSLFLGHPLQLIFSSFELLALIAGVVITALVSADGESNWLEGAELLAVYLILGLAFFLLP